MADRARDDHTQFGEDGIIEAIVERIGPKSRSCFEVGATDGLYYSGTKRLRDLGWRACLIEKDGPSFTKLLEHQTPLVTCLRAEVSVNVAYDIEDRKMTLDRLLDIAGMPFRPTVGILDIDGQEWHVWRSMIVFRPWIMCVEHADCSRCDLDYVPEPGGAGQAGLNAILALGRDKGYVPVCHNRINSIFVDCNGR